MIEANPFDSIKLGKLLPRAQRTSAFRADPFDIDEIDAIHAACSRDEDRNMLQFEFCTYMRPSEYIAVHWSSAREKHHHIAVEGAYVGGCHFKDSTKTPAGLRNIDMRLGALDALRVSFTGKVIRNARMNFPNSMPMMLDSTPPKFRPESKKPALAGLIFSGKRFRIAPNTPQVYQIHIQ